MGAMDDDDVSALARKHAADALRALSVIADDPKGDQANREAAQRGLENALLRLKELKDDPSISSELRIDIENTLRKFRQS
jgi:hypothetical protein